jgi:hypothetical protein
MDYPSGFERFGNELQKFVVFGHGAKRRFKIRPAGYKNHFSVNLLLRFFFASASLYIIPSTLASHYKRTATITTEVER